AANGWEFTGSTNGAGTSIGTFAPTSVVNGQNGYTSTEVTIPQSSTPTITVTETLRDGYTFQDATCTVDGNDVPVQIDGTSVSFAGQADASMACTFVNREPQPARTLTVQKTWVDG